MVSIQIFKNRIYAKLSFNEISHEELWLFKFPHIDDDCVYVDFETNKEQIILIALRTQKRERRVQMREAERLMNAKEPLELIEPMSMEELAEEGAT